MGLTGQGKQAHQPADYPLDFTALAGGAKLPDGQVNNFLGQRLGDLRQALRFGGVQVFAEPAEFLLAPLLERAFELVKDGRDQLILVAGGQLPKCNRSLVAGSANDWQGLVHRTDLNG